MKRNIILFAIVLISAIIFSSASAAVTDPVPIHSTYKCNESAVDGHQAVFAVDYDTDHDIMMKNLVNGSISTVSLNSSADEHNPDISSSSGSTLVVWQQKPLSGGSWQIYWKNMSSPSPVASPIYTLVQDQINPKISGTFVVWQQFMGYNDYDIVGYDLATRTYKTFTNTLTNETNPDIDGVNIVYQRYEDLGSGNWHWQVYNTTATALVNAGTRTEPYDADQVDPGTSGGFIVWSGYSSITSSFNIRCFNGYSGTWITSTAYNKMVPKICNYIIVWVENNLSDCNIMMYNLFNSSMLPVTSSHYWESFPAIGSDLYGIFVTYTRYEPGFTDKYVYWRNMDSSSPTLTSTDPLSNAVNVALDKTITVNFNKPIKVGTGWVELKASNGTLIPITMRINGNILTISHVSLLAAGTIYYLLLHTGSVIDYANNSLAPATKGFTTTTHTIAPIITTIDPADNSINVARDKIITITFSEAIKWGTGWIELKKSDGTLIPITAGISGSTLIINHSNLLDPGTKYNILLHTDSTRDLAGNPLTGTLKSFNTTTHTTAPTISTIDPANNAVNVPRNKVITVTFSEPIKWGTGWIELKANDSTVIPITASISGSTLTINHASLLAAGTTYNIILHTNSIRDSAGNPLAGVIRSFTTGSI